MKKLVVAIMMAMMVTVTVCAQKVKRPDTYNYNRGVELLNNDELDEGIEYLEAELKENPKNSYAILWMTVAYYAKEDYSSALTNINKALNLLPKKDKEYRAFAYNVRSRLYKILGEDEKALTDLSKSVELQPENTDFLEERAQIYFEREEYELSNKDYKKISELDEGSVMGYMGVGRNAMKQKRYDDALKQFDYVVKMASDYASGYSFRAEAYIKKGEYNKAADDIVVALDIDNDNKAFYLLSEIADSAKMVMEAKLKAKGLKDKNSPKWQLYLGIVNEEVENYEKAIEYYKKAMELYPASYYAYRIYVCYEAMGDYPHALEHIDYAIEMDSTDARDIQMRAELLFHMGRFEECMQTIDKFIDEAPDYWGGYCNRGIYKENMGNIEGAIEDYSMCIELEPELAYPYLKRADAYTLQGNTEAAMTDYHMVIRLDKEPNSDSNAMFAYQALGNKDEAKEFMKSMLEVSPDDQGCYYNAACLYARMNEQAEALAHLRRAFELGYRNFAHIEKDRDLNSIRESEEFKGLIEEFKKKLKWGVEEIVNEDDNATTYEEVVVEVPFTKEGSMCMVKCNINNLPLHFIFDTGASVVSISDVEATFMMKNGYLSAKDVVGKHHFLIADGSVSEGTILNLRNVNFGGLTLENVQASVVKNQRAPLLLGQSVMQKLGRIEIDNERRVLKITYKKPIK